MSTLSNVMSTQKPELSFEDNQSDYSISLAASFLKAREYTCPPHLMYTSAHFLCKAINAFKAIDRDDYREARRLLADLICGVEKHMKVQNYGSKEFETDFNNTYNDQEIDNSQKKAQPITRKRHTVTGASNENITPVDMAAIDRWGKSYDKYVPSAAAFISSPLRSPSPLHYEPSVPDRPPRRPSPFDCRKILATATPRYDQDDDDDTTDAAVNLSVSTDASPKPAHKRLRTPSLTEDEDDDVPSKVSKQSSSVREEDVPSKASKRSSLCEESEEEKSDEDGPTVSKRRKSTLCKSKQKAIVLTLKDNVITCKWGAVSYLRNKLKTQTVLLAMINNTDQDFKKMWQKVITYAIDNHDVTMVNKRSLSCTHTNEIRTIKLKIKSVFKDFGLEHLENLYN
ncbi:Maph25 [Matsumuraeses phaseoli granulovirus]|uniref:Maph25 n=1 Tax=Matsumuraeses phaseoli granulovirus TaxID=2760664 RepID=A0AAE7MLE0_9BBAC|nr:Maph25 [Matsumuraeses phaseoli granulovirus]QOD39988.1 Maph25 [Matsumuraeses phaseoli granulovirus]